MTTQRALAVLALLFWTACAWAQDGPSSIRIDGPSGRGSFMCYASGCMSDSPQWRQSRLNNLRQIVENDCNRRSVNFTEARCDKARDEYSAAQDCYSNTCSRATCRSRNLTTGQCVSPAYFR